VMLTEAVDSPETMVPCLQMATEFNLAFASKLIQFAGAEIPAAGAAVPYCWMVFGSAGRGETLTPEQLELGVVFADPPAEDDGATSKYFSAVGGIVVKSLAALGFENLPEVAVGSLSAWEQRYRNWINDPILSSIYTARTMFDFQPVAGDSELAGKLRATIAAGLKDSDIFIPVLANDTMSNVPPMTFFRGIVIELDGAESKTLDMERSAMAPMADAARVFALAAGNVAASNTLDRLEVASQALPQHEQIFRDAADAFRVVTYESAIASLRGGDGRGQVNASVVGKYDQRLLKTAFQSIHRFLEFTASTYTAMEDL
jgi:CBS domain-containing protein